MIYTQIWASQVALVVKYALSNARDIRDMGSVSGLGRSPGGGHGNPIQYSCLENPMDRGVWRTTVHGVAKSQTRLKRLSMHTLCVVTLGSHFLVRKNWKLISEFHYV